MTSIGARIEHATTELAGGRTGVRETNDELASFEAWYRAEHPRLLAALAVACGDRHVAQDVAAEAFARALSAWRRVSAMDEPTGWTYRVAVNLLKRRARRASTESRVLGSLAPTFVAASDHEAVELWDAVAGLPPRERLAIALRYASGLSEAEVAVAMGVATGTASSTLASARRRLALALQDETEPAHD